jgi:hypothetical protein
MGQIGGDVVFMARPWGLSMLITGCPGGELIWGSGISGVMESLTAQTMELVSVVPLTSPGTGMRDAGCGGARILCEGSSWLRELWMDELGWMSLDG